MRLICACCGNYTFFECEVESIQIITPLSNGLIIKDQDNEGVFDSGGWIRLGLIEQVEFCERQDREALQWDPKEGCYVNSHITCAHCGSHRVSIPYRSWSPPRSEMSLTEEVLHNHKEYSWLRKERKYADTLP
jgi:hypothetical protein